MNRIMWAAQFATEAHKSQVRKYTNAPYITHPARVAGRVATLPGATEDMVVAAFLHDVVEDTTVTLDEIEKEFGKQVATYVDQLTNRTHDSKLPRAERKKLDRDRLATAFFEVRLIKMVDRIDNLREIPTEAGDFRKLYAQESRLLAHVIGNAYTPLKHELMKACDDLIADPGFQNEMS